MLALIELDAHEELTEELITPAILDAYTYEAVWAVVMNADAEIHDALVAVNGTKLMAYAVPAFVENEELIELDAQDAESVEGMTGIGAQDALMANDALVTTPTTLAAETKDAV